MAPQVDQVLLVWLAVLEHLVKMDLMELLA